MKNIKAISISGMAVVVVITLLTIIGEIAHPLKDVLAAMTGHHWVSKSIIGMVLFLVLTIILGYTTKADNKNSAKYLWGLFWVTLGGSLAMFVYFVIHAMA